MTPPLASLLHRDSPPARIGGLLIGLGIGLGLVVMLVGWALPRLVGVIVGGAEDLDARLGDQNVIIEQACTAEIGSTELCDCAASTQQPAIDCMPEFRAWALDVQLRRCGDAPEAIAYCACLEQLQANATEAKDSSERARALTHYDNCAQLEDAFALPSVDASP